MRWRLHVGAERMFVYAWELQRVQCMPHTLKGWLLRAESGELRCEKPAGRLLSTFSCSMFWCLLVQHRQTEADRHQALMSADPEEETTCSASISVCFSKRAKKTILFCLILFYTLPLYQCLSEVYTPTYRGVFLTHSLADLLKSYTSSNK